MRLVKLFSSGIVILSIKDRNVWRSLLGLTLVSGVLFFSSIGASDLSEREAREALAVSEMVGHGDYFLPKINGDTLRTKPPLFHWAASIFALWRGSVDETAVRLPSAVSATAGVLGVFCFGAFFFNLRTGLLGSLVLATNVKYLEMGNRSRVDMTLCLFIFLAFFLFYWGYRKRRSLWFTLSFCAMGLAVLTKGPVGLLFPLLAILSFLAIRGEMRLLREIHLLKGLCLVLAFLSLWLIPALSVGGGELVDIAYQETLARFLGTTTHQAHIEPFYYYFPQILGGFAPWSLFLPAAFVFYFREAGKNEAVLYILLWFITIFLFLSLSAGKRGDYLLPLYPAAAILVGKLWGDFMDKEKREKLRRFFLLSSFPVPAAGVFLVLAALALLVSKSSVSALILPFLTEEDGAALVFFMKEFEGWVPFFSLLLLILGSCALAQFIAVIKRKPLMSFSFLSAICLLLAVSVGFALPGINAMLSLKTFMQEVRERVPPDGRIFFYDRTRLKMVFYAGRPIPLAPRGSLGEYFKGGKPAYLISPMKALGEVRKQIRSPLYILASYQNFRDGYALLSNHRE